MNGRGPLPRSRGAFRAWRPCPCRQGTLLALCVCLTIVGGCERRAADAAADAHLHVVAPLVEPYVALRLYGLVANHEPQGYQPVLPWLPVDELAPEGTEVEPGDQLLGLNLTVAQMWADVRRLDIKSAETQLRLERLQTAQGIDALDVKRRDLEQQDQVLAARIEATTVRDETELAIAELELEHAKRSMARAERHLVRLKQLASRGAAGDRQLRQAEADFERARQAVRVPAGNVELLRTTTGAATRRLLQLDRESMSLELGSPEHLEGVFRSIAALRRKQELQALLAKSRLREWREQQERHGRLEADNAIRADRAGVLRYREGGLRRGSRVRPASMVFVLRDEDMGFTFDLPVRWRNLLTTARLDDPEAGRVEVDVPQLSLRRRIGHVRAISARPYRAHGGRAYRCTVALAEPLPGMREGMQVDCTFRVRVPPDALELPAWAVRDPADPWVVMADGARRAVQGRFIGHRFIVFGGLSVGERVRARIDDDEANALHLSGQVRPAESLDLDVPWSVEIVDMVDDGSRVEKGQVIATVVSTRRNPTEDRIVEAQQVRDQADVKLEVARIEAEAELAKSYVTWRQAALEVDEARLRALLERYGSYGDDPTAADVAHRLARLRLDAAEQRLTEVEDPASADTVSKHQVRDARLNRDRGRLATTKAELGAVAVLRQRDWVRVWASEVAVHDAEQKAATLRDQYSQQRETYHLALARADDRHQHDVDRERRILRRHERETVRAPFDGTVYYHFDDWGGDAEGRPLKTGRRLRTTRPFYMAVDDRRQVNIEVPVRFHGRFQLGQQIPVRLSVLGSKSITGKVAAISRHFHVSELAADEHLIRGTAGVPPMAFTLTLDLELDAKATALARPGVTAIMELQP